MTIIDHTADLSVDLRSERELLDLTVVALSVEQVTQMGEVATAGPDRTAARIRLIARTTDVGPQGWLGRRWSRWAGVFGLPRPAIGRRPAPEVLFAPYAAVGMPHRRLAPYLTGVLAVFDATLAVAEGGADPAAARLLAGAWREACLPSPVTAETVYGPHTRAVRSVLSAAALMPRRPRPPGWDEIRSAVEDTAVTWGVPFLPRHLHAEAVEAVGAERADAVWGAAVAAAFADRLPAGVREVLSPDGAR